MRTIFLSGSMTGLLRNDALLWRNVIKNKIREKGLDDSYAFLESIPDEEDEIIQTSGKSPLTTQKAEFRKDLWLIDQSDILVVNLGLKTKKISIGTIFEISYAYAKGKLIIGLGDDDRYKHPFIDESISIRVKDIEELIHTLEQL